MFAFSNVTDKGHAMHKLNTPNTLYPVPGYIYCMTCSLTDWRVLWDTISQCATAWFVPGISLGWNIRTDIVGVVLMLGMYYRRIERRNVNITHLVQTVAHLRLWIHHYYIPVTWRTHTHLLLTAGLLLMKCLVCDRLSHIYLVCSSLKF